MIETLLPFESGYHHGHPYVACGEGERTMVILPGVNDPILRPTKPRWFRLIAANVCRNYAADRRVVWLGRRPGLGEGATIGDMASQCTDVLDELEPVDVLGISMGGFVVQHLAANHPESIDTAICALAGQRVTGEGRAELERWLEWARTDQWERIYVDAAGTVSGGLRQRLLYGIARLYDRIGSKPTAGAEDFIVTLEATLENDSTSLLEEISVPTLIVGGTEDNMFEQAQFEAAADRIDESTYISIDGGHEVVVNKPDRFRGIITDFLDESSYNQ